MGEKPQLIFRTEIRYGTTISEHSPNWYYIYVCRQHSFVNPFGKIGWETERGKASSDSEAVLSAAEDSISAAWNWNGMAYLMRRMQNESWSLWQTYGTESAVADRTTRKVPTVYFKYLNERQWIQVWEKMVCTFGLLDISRNHIQLSYSYFGSALLLCCSDQPI